jgi:hypothetical protein
MITKKHTSISIPNNVIKKTKHNTNRIFLKSLAYISDSELNQLARITNKKSIMKYIGKGNLWSSKDLIEYRNDEKNENRLLGSKRKHYSYVLILGNKVIGFIQGRKNNNLINLSIYPEHNLNKKKIKINDKDNILLRMFIDDMYNGKGFGKMIINLFINKYRKINTNKNNTNNGFSSNKILISDIDPMNIASIKIHIANNFFKIGNVKYPNGKLYHRYIYSYS